jgi:hypothetical protein
MHQLREVVAVLLLCATAAVLLYGTFLGIRMHVSKAMPAWAIGHLVGCALGAAALFTIGSRIEPLPARRNRRGKRWINVETPTQRQIWETALGDFVESILTAIGIMGTLVMLVIDFFLVAGDGDFLDMFIALSVGVGGFALEGAFVKWRGRTMFDPPGKPLPPKEEKEMKQAAADHSDVDVGSFSSDSDGSGHAADSGSDGD